MKEKAVVVVFEGSDPELSWRGWGPTMETSGPWLTLRDAQGYIQRVYSAYTLDELQVQDADDWDKERQSPFGATLKVHLS